MGHTSLGANDLRSVAIVSGVTMLTVSGSGSASRRWHDGGWDFTVVTGRMIEDV